MAQQSKLGTVATSVWREGNNIAVRYHDTVVVSVHDTGKVILNSGGWRTATTKTRMNQAARQFGLNYTVYQEKSKWFVCAWLEGMEPFKEGKRQDFRDGMTVEYPEGGDRV